MYRWPLSTVLLLGTVGAVGCQSILGIDDYAGIGGSNAATSTFSAASGGTGGTGGVATAGGGASGGSGGTGGTFDPWACRQALDQAAIFGVVDPGTTSDDRLRMRSIARPVGKLVFALDLAAGTPSSEVTYRETNVAPVSLAQPQDDYRRCILVQLEASTGAFNRRWISSSDGLNPDCFASKILASGNNFWLAGTANDSKFGPNSDDYQISDETGNSFSRGGFALKFETTSEAKLDEFFFLGDALERMHTISFLPNGDLYAAGDFTTQACAGDTPTVRQECKPCPANTQCGVSRTSSGNNVVEFPPDLNATEYTIADSATHGSRLIAARNRGPSGSDSTATATFTPDYPNGIVRSDIKSDNVRLTATGMSANVSYYAGTFTGTSLQVDNIVVAAGADRAFGFFAEDAGTFGSPQITTFSGPSAATVVSAMSVADGRVALGINTQLPMTIVRPDGTAYIIENNNDMGVGAVVIVIDEAEVGCVQYFWLGENSFISGIDVDSSSVAVLGKFTGSLRLPGLVSIPSVGTPLGFVAQLPLPAP